MLFLLESLKETNNSAVTRGRMFLSRRKAKRFREKVVGKYGREIVNNGTLAIIKEYAEAEFGSSSYWPWLALYTEIRGEFHPGWIPQDYYRFTLLKKYNPAEACGIGGYKTFDHELFPRFSLDPLFMVISGNCYSPHREIISEKRVKEILKCHGDEVVVKEALGSQGRQVRFFNFNQVTSDIFEPGKSYVVQPAVKQHEQLAQLHPASLNTIRIFTFLEFNGKVTTKFAFLRFGLNGSRVDNVSSGGGHCMVNIDGRVDSCYLDKYGCKVDDRHPDTGVVFRELEIPNFEKALRLCEEAHRKFPYVRFIGWDVSINRQVEPVLIEWNADIPTFWMQEALIGPMWEKIPH